MAYFQPLDRYANSRFQFYVEEILSLLEPSSDDTLKRQNVINELKCALRTDQSLIGCNLRPFGSFISNLYAKSGDLDISIDLTQSRSSAATRLRKLNILQKIVWALQNTGVASELEFVRTARVPIVVYQSKRYNISCDISIDNYAGYVKSYVLRLISDIDDRFRKVVLLIKEFAKAQQIADPKNGTLNSYSLCLLVIFHFQTCRPAIFPVIKDLYEGRIVDDAKGDATLKQIEDSISAKIASYRSQISGQRNQSSIWELVITFFETFLHLRTFAASNYSISTYTGLWKPSSLNKRLLWKSQRLFIEDPFDPTENAARAVDDEGLIQISQKFKKLYWLLSSRYGPADGTSLVSNLVRPEIRSMGLSRESNHYMVNH